MSQPKLAVCLILYIVTNIINTNKVTILLSDGYVLAQRYELRLPTFSVTGLTTTT